MDGWSIKSVNSESLIRGKPINKVAVGEYVQKEKDFIKIYSDNSNPKVYLDETVYNK